MLQIMICDIIVSGIDLLMSGNVGINGEIEFEYYLMSTTWISNVKVSPASG